MCAYIKILNEFLIFSVKTFLMSFPGGKIVFFRNVKVITKFEIVFYWDSLCWLKQ